MKVVIDGTADKSKVALISGNFFHLHLKTWATFVITRMNGSPSIVHGFCPQVPSEQFVVR